MIDSFRDSYRIHRACKLVTIIDAEGDSSAKMDNAFVLLYKWRRTLLVSKETHYFPNEIKHTRIMSFYDNAFLLLYKWAEDPARVKRKTHLIS